MNPNLPKLSENPDDLKGFKNLYLKTDLGQIDFLGDLPGVGTFEDATKESEVAAMGDFSCAYLTLDALIAAKKSAGRPKDRRAIEILEVIRRERQGKTGV